MAGRVLIGGGTGFVGRNLKRVLKKNGYDVTVVSRNSGPDKITWDDIRKSGLPSEVTAVVNLAGENVLNFAKRWTHDFKESVYHSRVDTTSLLSKTIVDASKKPKAFVAISGVGIYPPSDSAEYTESTPVKEFDFLSKLCHHWEASAVPADTHRTVSIRSGVILGRDGGMIQNLYLPFSLGLGGKIASGNQILPWIHIDDLTNLILYSIQKNVTGILNGVAPQKTSNTQFTQAFAKALSRPAFFPVPEFVFNILLGKERAMMITQGQYVVPKRTLEVGFKYKYPSIQEACDAIVKSK